MSASGYTAFARHYDDLTRNVDYPARAAYFDGLLRQEGERGLLLDLACGTGSLSLALAERGWDVIGADSSPEMLGIAQQKAIEAGRSMLFLNQSMEELDLYGTVDAAVCALDSLNHLPGLSAVKRAFSRLSLFVRPGGLLAFDVNTLHKHRQVLGDNAFVYETDQVLCVWRNALREDDGIDIELDFFEPQKDGRYLRSREAFTERYYSRELLEGALAANNFTLLAVYAADTLEQPGEDTQRDVYLAVRNQ
ncbi:MAG: class I SAM-dependent DNA methyltransferase [Oscillospiraceae bacterium]